MLKGPSKAPACRDQDLRRDARAQGCEPQARAEDSRRDHHPRTVRLSLLWRSVHGLLDPVVAVIPTLKLPRLHSLWLCSPFSSSCGLFGRTRTSRFATPARSKDPSGHRCESSASSRGVGGSSACSLGDPRSSGRSNRLAGPTNQILRGNAPREMSTACSSKIKAGRTSLRLSRPSLYRTGTQSSHLDLHQLYQNFSANMPCACTGVSCAPPPRPSPPR